MTWTVEPHAEGAAIAMTATTASDPSGVEYYFANLTDSSHDSGWQSDPSYADIGLLLNTQYTYTVTARDLSVGMNQTAPSAQASATTTDAAPVHINFQPDDVAIPSGFIPDYGAVFGDRGGGLFYGWNIDHTTEPRDRDNHAQHELDTICHMLEGAAWEWAAANGEYIIEVTIGDPSFSSTHTINVEGVNYWNQAFLGAGEFQTLSRTIQVTDGRIHPRPGPRPQPSHPHLPPHHHPPRPIPSRRPPHPLDPLLVSSPGNSSVKSRQGRLSVAQHFECWDWRKTSFQVP